MITKYKNIIIAAIVVIVVISCLCLYIYIDNLRDEVSSLTSTITERDATINQLSQNINSLKAQIDSLNDTLIITDEYISDIQDIKTEEDIIKDAIYNEVINDETDETKNWFNERLPSNIVNVLNDSNKRMCKDSI